MSNLFVDNIELPVAIEDFITPDLEQGCDFYPQYLVKSCLRGQGFRSFQGYLLEMCYQLEKAEAREGRDRDQYFQRFLEHFGIGKLKEYCHDYQLPLS